MKTLWTALVTGYVILLAAIAINGVVTALGIKTWYGLFEEPSVTVLEGAFLFALYPLSLGLAGTLGSRLGRRTWALLTRGPTAGA